MQTSEFLDMLSDALKASFRSYRSVGITLIASVIFYILMVFSSFPEYTYQIIAYSPASIFMAVRFLSISLIAAGMLNFVLTIIYSVMGGIAVSNMVDQLKYQGGGAESLATLSPGLLVAGCTSCGAGLLGLIGFTGALAVLPFEGNLVRTGGILLILFFLGRSGDPRVCNLE